jgi:hypothetical protein
MGDLAYRLEYWNEFMGNPVAALNVFGCKLPLELMDGFSRVLSDNDEGHGRGESTNGQFFLGMCLSDGVYGYTEHLSFVHLAAYAGQDEYVLREVSKRPELLKGGGMRNLLLASAIGGHKGLAAALIAMGSSPIPPLGS